MLDVTKTQYDLVVALCGLDCGNVRSNRLRIERRDQGQGGYRQQTVCRELTLAHMAAMLIEAETGLEVDVKIGMGATEMLHPALVEGQIDLYPDTGHSMDGGPEGDVIHDRQEIFEENKEATRRSSASPASIPWASEYLCYCHAPGGL